MPCGIAGSLSFTLEEGMKIVHILFATTLAAAFSGATLAQDSSKPAEDIPDAPQATAAALIHPNGPTVVMDTSMGRITCQFFQKQVPNAVANFIGLAEGTKDWTDPTTKQVQHHKPLYDGTTFHRVIPASVPTPTPAPSASRELIRRLGSSPATAATRLPST